MSGDERRGTDGGEHPLDVDARFADIIAHFHDGEPAPPRVVDDHDARPRAGAADPSDDDRADLDPPEGLAAGDDSDDSDGGASGDVSHGPTAWRSVPASDTASDPATDWAARYEQAAREELAAHEERTARLAREARVAAEVDRAVDGPDSRYVPDEPPPLPRPADLPGRLAWGAVLLGPVALVLFALLWRSAPPWLLGSVVTAIVTGFAYLVWRLPRTHDRDDGGDGAIV